jgi:hypothetical protein
MRIILLNKFMQRVHIKNLFATLAICIISFISPAQAVWERIEGNAGVGQSIFNNLFIIRNNEFPTATIHNWNKPAWCAGLDYRVHKHFSVGVGGGVQTIGQDLQNIEITIKDQTTQFGLLNYQITRINAGLRALGHVPSKNNLWDFYAGAKMGWSLFDLKVTQTNNDIFKYFEDRLKFGTGAPSFQIIPFGARYYGVKYVGIYVETAIGAPAYISGGICFRLGTAAATSSKVSKN